MRIVSLDLETPKISRGPGAAPRPVIVSIHTDTEHYLARPGDMDWSFLNDSLIIGANIAFDMSVLIRWIPRIRPLILMAYAEGRILDLQVAHTLVAISYGAVGGATNLERLAGLYCGVELDKDSWRLLYERLEAIPLEYWPSGAVEYALTDSYIARKVFDEIVAADQYGALGLLGHATYSAWGLHEAEVDGVRTHPVRARKLVASAEKRIDRVQKRLERSGLLRLEGTKNMTLARSYMERWCKAQGRPVKLTAKDQVGLSEEVVEASGSRLLGLFVEHTQASKMRTAARNLLLGIDLPLQTRFNSCMETYRTSSSMPKEDKALVGVQMQNPWKVGGYREVFTPDQPRKPDLVMAPWEAEFVNECGELDGELFIGADYTMAEVYSLAQVCRVMFGYSKLGDTLNSGRDVHLMTAAMILGCTYEEILAHPDRKHYRQIAKALVFGIPGGLGAAKMVLYARGYGVEITENEARRYIHQFKSFYPEVGEYLEWVSSRGYPWRLVHPITGFVRGGVGYTDGSNTGFQNLTAFYAKGATARAAAARWDPASPLYGFKVWNMVHDEILGRGPAHRAPAAARELERIMVSTANEVLTHYPIKADPWVASAWSKQIPDKMDVSKPWIFEDAVTQWRAENTQEARKALFSTGML